MLCMSFDESLEVFCLNAFGQDHPKEGYEDVSREAACWGGRGYQPQDMTLYGLSSSSHVKMIQGQKTRFEGIPGWEAQASIFNGEHSDFHVSGVEKPGMKVKRVLYYILL
ncbi:hypothetical protein L1987_76459 [Smallanthus sonchifolius]|uniref:Uncharacterized protein n=1 Tax=Smallanthus sonchifolius TaxID=185202 RepID=A0ACB8Z726_9ASTR|nr:hypothetical protein L1987_76459 [Smallanthus sonchifolius]